MGEKISVIKSKHFILILQRYEYLCTFILMSRWTLIVIIFHKIMIISHSRIKCNLLLIIPKRLFNDTNIKCAMYFFYNFHLHI